jgi:hypothetical protein
MVIKIYDSVRFDEIQKFIKYFKLNEGNNIRSCEILESDGVDDIFNNEELYDIEDNEYVEFVLVV